MGQANAGTAAGATRVIDLKTTGVTANTMFTDGSALWLAGAGPPEGGRVVKIDLEAGRVAWSVDVPDDIVGLGVTNGVVFAAGGGDGADPTGGVTRLDWTHSSEEAHPTQLRPAARPHQGHGGGAGTTISGASFRTRPLRA